MSHPSKNAQYSNKRKLSGQFQNVFTKIFRYRLLMFFLRLRNILFKNLSHAVLNGPITCTGAVPRWVAYTRCNGQQCSNAGGHNRTADDEDGVAQSVEHWTANLATRVRSPVGEESSDLICAFLHVQMESNWAGLSVCNCRHTGK